MSVTPLVADAVWSNIESTGSGISPFHFFSLYFSLFTRKIFIEFSIFLAVTEEQLSMSVLSPIQFALYIDTESDYDLILLYSQRLLIFAQSFGMWA